LTAIAAGFRLGAPMVAKPPQIARVALLASLVAAGCTAPGPPRNLLLITVDTLRADHVAGFGGKTPTPGFDRLAARGASFAQAMTTVPLTTPAHASLLTGLYPTHHGVRVHGVNGLAANVTTLAQDMIRSGRTTGAVVAAYPVARLFGLDRGFASYDDQFGRLASGRPRLQRSADEVTRRARDWLGQHRQQPFFLWVHYYDPHAPYAPPEPYRTQYASDPYSGEVAYTDAEVGKLLDGLKELGLESTTLVALASDHGEGLLDHGEQEHGLLLYEDTLRVPLVLAGPGLPRGARVNEPVSLVDLRPTLDALLGLPPAAGDGLDLAPLWRGGTIAARTLYAETRFPEEEFAWSPLAAARRGALKLIAALPPELYDLERDPGEKHNLAAEHAAEVRELSAWLDAHAGEPATAASAPPPEAVEALQSLGYVAGGPGRAVHATGSAPNPRDRVADHQLYWRAVHLAFEGKAGDREEAATLLHQLVERDPGNPQFRLKLAEVLALSGHGDEAETTFRALLGDFPAWPTSARACADFLVATGRANDAVTLLRDFLDRNQGTVGLEENLALALRETGDRAGALEVARTLVAKRPGDTAARLLFGHLAGESGLLDESRAAFELVLKGDSTHPDAAFSLARVLEAQGDKAAALAVLRPALAANPGDRELRSEACALAHDVASPGEAAELCAPPTTR